MTTHPTADRSFFSSMLAAHARRYGPPSLSQTEYLRHVAEDFVEDMGVGVEFAVEGGGRRVSDWSRSRFEASSLARSPKHRVVRRFDTEYEDDD